MVTLRNRSDRQDSALIEALGAIDFCKNAPKLVTPN